MSSREFLDLAAPVFRTDELQHLEIAILIPCYNEELTIGRVISQFRTELPTATIYVFDNNSLDRTAEIARQAGAIVIHERRQGKGFVVQSMFRNVDADVYVMVDGDDTYPASEVHRLLAPVVNNEADMVVGSRLHADSQSTFKLLNLLGNRAFLAALNTFFGARLTDILSGYRVFSREFVKGVTLLGGGFEVETELTIKAVEGRFRIAEVPTNLGVRPQGSNSKIRLVRDGFRILGMILALLRDYRPLMFFGALACLLMGSALIPGTVVILEFLRTGLVLHMPSTVLAMGLMLSGMLSLTVGLILHSMSRRIHELEYLIRCIAGREASESARSLRRAG
jgi:glycosyltransferase involved in cell wall biosynthesis